LQSRGFSAFLSSTRNLSVSLPFASGLLRSCTTTTRHCAEMSEQETQRPGMGEQEPLLGRPGDASQQDGLPLYHNLIIGTVMLHAGLCKATILTSFAGTGAVAQAGSWILVAIVWGAVFSNPVILFSAHPVRLVGPSTQKTMLT
jgi:hypothetical protein